MTAIPAPGPGFAAAHVADSPAPPPLRDGARLLMRRVVLGLAEAGAVLARRVCAAARGVAAAEDPQAAADLVTRAAMGGALLRRAARWIAALRRHLDHEAKAARDFGYLLATLRPRPARDAAEGVRDAAPRSRRTAAPRPPGGIARGSIARMVAAMPVPEAVGFICKDLDAAAGMLGASDQSAWIDALRREAEAIAAGPPPMGNPAAQPEPEPAPATESGAEPAPFAEPPPQAAQAAHRAPEAAGAWDSS